MEESSETDLTDYAKSFDTVLQTQLLLEYWLSFTWDLLEMVRLEDTQLSQVFDRALAVVESADPFTTRATHELESMDSNLHAAINTLIPAVTEFVHRQPQEEQQYSGEIPLSQGIPPLNELGYLPPGLHQTTWSDFACRFGTNERRQAQLPGALAALLQLKQASIKEVRIGGSFVTAKCGPVDIDLYWSSEGVDLSLLDPLFQENDDGQTLNNLFFGLKRLIFGVDIHQLRDPNSLLFNYTRSSSRKWKSPSTHLSCFQEYKYCQDERLRDLLAKVQERRRVGAIVLTLTDELPEVDFVPGSTWKQPEHIRVDNLPERELKTSPYLTAMAKMQK